jgi:hypothetical protein
MISNVYQLAIKKKDSLDIDKAAILIGDGATGW